MSKQIMVPTVRGEWGSYEVTENGVTAKRINGEVLYHFEKSDNKPSAVKFESNSNKGGMHISIQYLKDGKKNNHPDNMETREESASGNGVFDLNKLKNGHYILRAFAKNAENISFRYEFLN